MMLIKISGEPVFNLFDLKKNFSPRELLLNLEKFINFAVLHCLPLVSHLVCRKHPQEIYVAKYLTKDFWFEIIKQPQAQAKKSAQEFLKNVLKDNYESWSEELQDADILNKLEFIAQNNKANYPESFILLAIAELCEVNAMETDKTLWADIELASKDQSKINAINYFDATQSVQELRAREQPYRFFYHESDRLPDQNSLIKTVCVRALSNNLNKNLNVSIELYNRHSVLEQSLSLMPGEFRYCNVYEGKIIKFLPCVSISHDICIARKDYASDEITIFNKLNTVVNTLNLQNVSSVAAGNNEQGVLLVKDARADLRYFRLANPSDQNYLNMQRLKVVEAAFVNDECQILFENGVVLSKAGHEFKKVKDGAAFLTRSFTPVIGNNEAAQHYTETAVSESGRSAAVLSRKNLLTFFPGSKGFYIRRRRNNFVIEID
ncbi:MAG: hypothetical protein IJQ63_04240 [Synergistaceae bacterium]|nr:hypothetical protein [Synergistaceae bacterium]